MDSSAHDRLSAAKVLLLKLKANQITRKQKAKYLTPTIGQTFVEARGAGRYFVHIGLRIAGMEHVLSGLENTNSGSLAESSEMVFPMRIPSVRRGIAAIGTDRRDKNVLHLVSPPAGHRFRVKRVRLGGQSIRIAFVV